MKPTIEELENLLLSVRPEPSARFKARMRHMPWMEEKHHPRTHRILQFNRRLQMFALAAAAFMFVIGWLLVPVLNTLPDQIAALLDPPAAEDSAPDPDSGVAEDGAGSVYHTPNVSALQPDEVEEVFETSSDLVGFEVKPPEYVPEGFTFDAVTVVEEDLFVRLSYTGTGEGEALIINILDLSKETETNYTMGAVGTKTDADADAPSNGIGEDEPPFTAAEEVDVMIGEIAAIYLSGEWQPAEHTGQFNPDADEDAPLTGIGETGIPAQILRWEMENISFEIIYFGKNLTVEDLILIAESLMN